MRQLAAVVLLAFVGRACAAVGQASVVAPNGMPPVVTPQFVLFTHDDAIEQGTYDMLHEVTDGKVANGCPLTATLFTQVQGTDCSLVKKLWSSGFEIADHTKNHKHMLDLRLGDLRDEILGGRQGLADCGIPIQSIQGFRTPYLETNQAIRMVLKNNNYLYDSSLMEEGTGHSLSQGMNARVWPWDMANGIPINCGWYSETQKCDKNESYPGLWQVPVWNLDAVGNEYTMDPGEDDKAAVYDILKTNFDDAYNGNRAPFPIFIHSPWMAKGNHLDDLKKFADYARDLPHVYFITMRQLIAWLKSPIPAGQLTPLKLGCRNWGGAPATPQQLAAAMPKPPPPKASPPPKMPPPKSPPPPVVVVPPVVVPPVVVPVIQPVTTVDPDTQPVAVDPLLPVVGSPLPVTDPLAVNPVTGVAPLTTSPAPAVITTQPSTVPSPNMPPSGIRITMTIGGGSEDTFRRITEPQLLSVLHQVVAEGSDSPAFISSLTVLPAGASRRRALQQGDQKLQAVAVVGGSQPLVMYKAAESSLGQGKIGKVLALSGTYLATPPTIVPFQNGVDMPAPASIAASPAAATATPASPTATPQPVPSTAPATADPSSSSGSSSSNGGSGPSIGVILGASIGCAAAVIVAAGLVYWLVWRPRHRRTATVVDVSPAGSMKKAHSASDTSSQGSLPEPRTRLDIGARVASNALYEEA